MNTETEKAARRFLLMIETGQTTRTESLLALRMLHLKPGKKLTNERAKNITQSIRNEKPLITRSAMLYETGALFGCRVLYADRKQRRTTQTMINH